MWTTIKAFFVDKMIMIVAIVGSLLLAGLGTVWVMYELKAKDYETQSVQYEQVVKDKVDVEAQLKGVNEQIADERARHATLELKMKKSYELYAQRMKTLLDAKNDQIKKQVAMKDPKSYEIESQKALVESQNRLNCLTGNVASCSKQ